MSAHELRKPRPSSVPLETRTLLAALKGRLKFKINRSGAITRKVRRALALQPRGFVARDILLVSHLAVRLHVEWLARDVHPWDRHLPQERRAELFAHQCLEDVDAAIRRLLGKLPEVDVLEIAVFDPNSRAKIITGLIRRDDAVTPKRLALGMRLKAMGVAYRLSNLRFEPIQ